MKKITVEEAYDLMSKESFEQKETFQEEWKVKYHPVTVFNKYWIDNDDYVYYSCHYGGQEDEPLERKAIGIARRHGGKRQGSGRKPVGQTRRVSLTFPKEIWEMVDYRKKVWESNQSQTLRMMIEGYFNSPVEAGPGEELIPIQTELIEEIRKLSEKSNEIYEWMDAEHFIHHILITERDRLKKFNNNREERK